MATVSLENRISATLESQDAAQKSWDVVIIGAGPTGSLAARQLTLAGADVLLVDRQSFPRWKVCGCCLNARAVSILEQTELLEEVYAAGAVPLTEFQLRINGHSVTLPLSNSLSLSRTQLDALLIRSAISAGSNFLPEAEARLGSSTSEYQEVVLTRHTKPITIRGKIVLVCEGLNPRLLNRTPEFSNSVDEHSCIGAGAVVPLKPGTLEAGTIFMAVGRAGYVGAVLVEEETLNLAAAILPSFLKEGRPLGTIIHQILQEAGCTLPVDVERLNWQGTARLTRKTSPVADGRVLVLGDASGYVEPFTGEGMGWGLSSAIACVPIVLDGIKDGNQSVVENWIQYHQHHIQNRQRWCRRCAFVLKRPRLARGLIHVLKYCPWIATPVIHHLNQP
ncbi:NAD(P)/FAD-dependent oxidoreductase [Gimesia aquarii]|uniref:3-(3-hydroxyphenyl)propionate hydroxylase n=1 Tax=Gimesia aquarii TaxID=2527964 RepID=A0A517W038_9PLAN|nr:NAD(P)/FAD-dependent oxidoreductase [Gimesia aquarii]QDT98623.1 3-(3-hydroxyphenyl)propionate hydroxylase [Gimesia aquarii]